MAPQLSYSRCHLDAINGFSYNYILIYLPSIRIYLGGAWIWPFLIAVILSLYVYKIALHLFPIWSLPKLHCHLCFRPTMPCFLNVYESAKRTLRPLGIVMYSTEKNRIIISNGARTIRWRKHLQKESERWRSKDAGLTHGCSESFLSAAGSLY